jgi:hypothetical protein
MKNTVFWDITLCSPLKVNWCCRTTYRLYLQGRISSARYQCESKWLTRPWRWKLYSFKMSVNFQLTTKSFIPEDIVLFTMLHVLAYKLLFFITIYKCSSIFYLFVTNMLTHQTRIIIHLTSIIVFITTSLGNVLIHSWGMLSLPCRTMYIQKPPFIFVERMSLRDICGWPNQMQWDRLACSTHGKRGERHAEFWQEYLETSWKTRGRGELNIKRNLEEIG